MLKSKWTQFFIALFIGFGLSYYFVGRNPETPSPVGKLSIPDLEFFDEKGEKQKSLSDFKGKTVLVSFWASWCEPCKKEIPELAELKSRLKDRDLEIVLVNEDDSPEEGMNFLKELKIDLSQLHSYYDKEFKNAQVLQMDSIPSSYLIDTAGFEIFSSQGYLNWLEGSAFKLLEEELKKN